MALTVRLSEKKNHLVFRDVEIGDDNIEVSQLVGILSIGDKISPEATLKQALKIAWEFEGTPDNNGFTKVVRA